MKFALILPTHLYSEHRRSIAMRSFASLSRTETNSKEPQLPLYIVCGDMNSWEAACQGLLKKQQFLARICVQPHDVPGGTDPALAWQIERVFEDTDCSHVVVLADDMIYHPRWFLELRALVERKPEAKAWSVYRSAHVRHHRTISQDNGDHLVTSLAGNGTCWSKEEWLAWGISWKQGPRWPLPDGNGDTLDLHHAYFRPGQRWVTGRSWMEHIGVLGMHVQAGVPEHALDFVGEQ